MNLLIALAVVFFLFSEPVLACSRHTTSLDNLALKSSITILLNALLLLTITTALGFLLGKGIRSRSQARRILAFTLLTSSLLAQGSHKAWGCHGTEMLVQPILKEIYEAQVTYHKKHGKYAGSFEDLGMTPAPNQFSYFLPSETLSAKNPLPKEGVDLSRLPEGIFPVASANKFTVVAIAFAEPDRIDVWTMDQRKRFNEWSVPAVSKRKIDSQGSQVTPYLTFNARLNRFEPFLKVISLLLGFAIGFAIALRPRPVIPIPERI